MKKIDFYEREYTLKEIFYFSFILLGKFKGYIFILIHY